MSRKEAKRAQVPWRAAAASAGASLAVYGLLQMVNALLLWRETAGEERAGFLVALSALLSLLVSILIFGRAVRTGRMVFCAVCCAAFLGAIALLALGFGEGSSPGNLAGIAAGAMIGSILAAIAGGRRKRGKKAAGRR